MSTPDAAHAGEHKGRSVLFYTAIAIFLAIVTFIELGPLFEWFNLPIPALLFLSVVKFFFVVAFFMHLWDDAGVFTRVFAAPLVGALLMVLVLMALFGTYNPSPREDPFAIQERYWTNWNGECSSWLVSSVSNRRYCASPLVEPSRVAMHDRSGASGGAAQPPPEDISGLPDDQKLAMLMERGQQIYEANCSTCHQEGGQGTAAYPPLAGSDYAGFQDKQQHIGIIINGLSGEITVLGRSYNGVMASFGALNDYNIAAVATYERNSWGNDHGMVTPDEVAAVR